MAKRDKTPAQPAPQSTLLERTKALLQETDAAYKRGDYKDEQKLAPFRGRWQEIMAGMEDRGSIMEWLALPVILGQYTADLLSFILQGFALQKYAALVTDWAAVVKATGTKPRGFNRPEGRKALDALNNGQVELPEGGNLLDFATFAESNQGIGYQLRSWIEREGWWAERPHTDKASVVDKAVAEAMASKTTPLPDPKAEAQGRLDAAKAAKAKALADEDGDALKAAKAAIADAEAELVKLTAAPPPAPEPPKPEPAPTTVKAEVGEIPGLNEAEAACTAAGAPKALQRLYKRWNDGDVTDKEFVAKVSEIKAVLS